MIYISKYNEKEQKVEIYIINKGESYADVYSSTDCFCGAEEGNRIGMKRSFDWQENPAGWDYCELCDVCGQTHS